MPLGRITGLLARSAHACTASLLLGVLATTCPPAALAQDITPFTSEQAQVRKPAGGPCTAGAPAMAFGGRARNGAYEGRMDLEVRTAASGSPRVGGTLAFSDGLVGEGRVDGSLTADGRMRLEGTVRSWPGGQYTVLVQAQLAGRSLAGTYSLSRSDGSEPQRGEFQLRGGAEFDARIVGVWGLLVPGAVANWELDRGTYVERLQRVSVGAPGGVLVIEPDGGYTWSARGARAAGRLIFCATANGDSGWAVTRGTETFWARYVSGNGGGFYLFSTASGSYTFQGKPLRK